MPVELLTGLSAVWVTTVLWAKVPPELKYCTEFCAMLPVTGGGGSGMAVSGGPSMEPVTFMVAAPLAVSPFFWKSETWTSVTVTVCGGPLVASTMMPWPKL